MAEPRAIMAPCSSCLGKRKHFILFQKRKYEEEADEHYSMIECAGCGRVSMEYRRVWRDEQDVDDVEYYPAPITRQEPSWLLHMILFRDHEESVIGSLLSEVYRAIPNEQRRLAALGIRALLEQVMVSNVGDLPTFEDKLDAFQKQGYISL